MDKFRSNFEEVTYIFYLYNKENIFFVQIKGQKQEPMELKISLGF